MTFLNRVCVAAIGGICLTVPVFADSDGLAPEVTDLNAADVSFAIEAKLPDLKKPFINSAPADRNDGIPVGKLGADGGDKKAILAFTDAIAAGDHGEIDSLLLFSKGKLLFESYFRRGRVNYPHYQMSITKSYTAMALGRAIQMEYLSMGDLEKPVVSLLEEIDQANLVKGATAITLAQAMNMRSGIRIDQKRAVALMKTPELLKGQKQIQAYLENSAAIPAAPREFKYQGSDPSITIQVIESITPGSASDFIKTEMLGKMGITNYGWQSDVSGLPKSAAGSSMRSRDMLKWGMLVMNRGVWKGEQLVPSAFVDQATSKIHINAQGSSYGYFWWRHEVMVGDRAFDCKTARGAGGQFLFLFPELDLIGVVTAHQKGMGDMLKVFPQKVIPGFLKK